MNVQKLTTVATEVATLSAPEARLVATETTSDVAAPKTDEAPDVITETRESN